MKHFEPNVITVLMKSVIFVSIISILPSPIDRVFAQQITETQRVTTDWVDGYPDGCTSITVGKKASDKGWVSTSHTCDSHRTRTWLDITAPADHKQGSVLTAVKRTNDDSLAMPAYKHVPVGEIPQISHTYGYINTAYPCMNQHQLAIGESTFGGRESLRSDNGLIDCQQLVHLLMQRCKTAREAIRLAGELTRKFGYIDEGECLTIADVHEVWHLEILGSGKHTRGSIWAAQRVPDDHISVNANASRIRQIDLADPDFFMASANIFTVAQDSGWWDPEEGLFEFCYTYSPESRQSFASRRREWRVFDLIAPSRKFHPDAENFPFSVKPDTLVTLEKLISIFKDYFEGTDFNMIKNITWTNEKGLTEISPLANPFMPYDMNPLFKINGGWGWRGERPIARWYTIYATITQSRDWLPDEIGGVVWLAFDNVASSIYTPLYCSISDVPDSYKTPGRKIGFTRDSAWWAFNRTGTLAAQRWGDMRKDIDAVWLPLQTQMINQQIIIENQALKLYNRNKKKAIKFLTDYSIEWGNITVNRCWELGDFLWTKYDEKF